MIVKPLKPINLPQLQAELSKAGISVTALGNALDANGNTIEVHTYTSDGTFAELPNGSDSIVAAHIAKPSPQQNAAQTLLTDMSYDLKSRQAFAIILNIFPGNPMFPTI